MLKFRVCSDIYDIIHVSSNDSSKIYSYTCIAIDVIYHMIHCHTSLWQLNNMLSPNNLHNPYI